MYQWLLLTDGDMSSSLGSSKMLRMDITHFGRSGVVAKLYQFLSLVSDHYFTSISQYLYKYFSENKCPKYSVYLNVNWLMSFILFDRSKLIYLAILEC